MKAKGTTIQSIKLFVQENYSAEYENWLKNLPEESKSIFQNELLLSEWYSFYESAILPVKLISKMFYEGDQDQAFYDIGTYSGQVSLRSGVYNKLLVGVTKDIFPQYMIQFYYLFFSEGTLRTTETKNTIAFEYHNHPDYCIANLPRTAGYLKVMYDLVKPPPYKVDWSHRKQKNGLYTGINTVYFE